MNTIIQLLCIAFAAVALYNDRSATAFLLVMVTIIHWLARRVKAT